MQRAILVISCLVLLAAWGASPAVAQEAQTVAPPGNSGVEEYLEIVPAAGGDRPADGGGQAADPAGRSDAEKTVAPATVLGAKTARELSRLGADGRAAAAVAAATAPNTNGGARKAGKDRSAGSGTPDGSLAEADAGHGAGAVAGALAGRGGGMGMAFPLVLLGAFAAAMGLVALRRVTRS